jgi:lamin tail-like protein
VVSEFNYHPTDPSAAEKALGYADDSAFEFIELLNISADGCDLSGVKVIQGVTFDFASAPLNARFLEPGARVVIVANTAGFSSRLNPGATPLIAGTYSGVLKNSGETLTLVDASNAVIKSFAYADSAPWPEDADGGGRTVVLNNPFANPDHTLANNWRPSAGLNGTPGSSDTAPLPSDLFGDDDGNGFSNLYDYALGMGGHLSLTTDLFTPPLGVSENYFYFRHPRSLLADGVKLQIESSTNLLDWTPLSLVYVSTVLNSGNGSSATVTYRSANSVSAIGQTFFVRLKVQQN